MYTLVNAPPSVNVTFFPLIGNPTLTDAQAALKSASAGQLRPCRKNVLPSLESVAGFPAA
jgi:hypothetical protein